MKFLILSLALVSFAAVAQVPEPDGRTFEPGPVVTMGDDAVAAVDVLQLAKVKDQNGFRKLGNAVTEITRQNLRPGVTVWRFTRKQCHTFGITGGLCMGGGMLTVTVKNIQMGSGVRTEATSSLGRFRD